MTLLTDVKEALRIDGTEHDNELEGLIDTAKALLLEVGVQPQKLLDTDPLIRKAVITYCKAEFGTDSKTSERYSWSFDEMKKLLSLLRSYTEITEV